MLAESGHAIQSQGKELKRLSLGRLNLCNPCKTLQVVEHIPAAHYHSEDVTLGSDLSHRYLEAVSYSRPSFPGLMHARLTSVVAGGRFLQISAGVRDSSGPRVRQTSAARV